MKEKLRKYWRWVVGVAIVTAAFIAFFLRNLLRTTIKAVPGESDVQRDADIDFQKKVDDAKQVEDKRIAEVKEAHDLALGKEEKELEDNTRKIEDDPKAVNDFLKDVGAKVREP